MVNTATENANPKPRRQRRMFRFGLLTLLGLVTLSAIVLALIVSPAQRQRRAVAYVRSLGGEVVYEPVVNVPPWLRELAGDDYFDDVYEVDLEMTEFNDAGLKDLNGLTALRSLDLGHTSVGDVGLKHLKGLTELRSLSLTSTQVTDVGLEQLKGLTRLQTLSLNFTQIGDAGLEHLTALTGLEELYLQGTQVSDAGLLHLSGLRSLHSLGLYRTQVSDAGLAELREALPDCDIP